MLCAGNMRREGWQTLDANPKNEPDFLAYIPQLPPAVTAIVWDEIEWIHGITSFYPWEGRSLLGEVHGILSPGGKLVLEQPDFNNVIGHVEWIFGDPTYRNPLHMNKWSFTPSTLTAMLKDAGFSHIEILPAQHHVPERDFRVEAYR